MIIDFFVDPSAVSERGGADLATRDFLRTAISRFGCQAGSGSDWMEIVKALPQTERKMWLETLRHVPRRPGKSVREIRSPSELDRGRDLDALVITCDEQIREWMMEHSMNNSDVPAWLATQRVEVSNCERSVLSLLIRSRDEWRSERIERGVTRDEVWTTRIGPVVSCANKLVIVDRYFMSIARRADRGIESARGGGAAWLFGKIGEVANANDPVEVVIYCSDAGEPAMNDEELSLVTKRILEFSKGAVSTLTVFTAPDRQFGQIEHDRYWRIWTGSRSLTLAFGNSIDLFDSKRLQRSSNFSYSVDRLVVDDSRTVELQLEKVSTKLVVARVDSATSDAEI